MANNTDPNLMATAPYNFVRLVPDIMLSPLVQDGTWSNLAKEERDAWATLSKEERIAKYKAYIQEKGKYTGYIDLALKSKTPIYIGGGKQVDEETVAFFSPAGKPIIPGSTIRGMVKNIFKIITLGSMRPGLDGDFNDSTLYFRSFADQYKNLRNHYYKQMGNHQKGKKVVTTAKPGFLVQMKDKKYYIVPARGHVEKIKNREYKSGGKVIWESNGDCSIITGSMNNKKHYQVIRKADFSKAHLGIEDSVLKPIPEKILYAYRDDTGRTTSSSNGAHTIDLLPKTTDKNENKNKYGKSGEAAHAYTGNSDIDYVIPCFYKIDKKGNVSHFGHGAYYRIPYSKSVGDHVPQELQADTVDFADAVFGNKELWASRLQFEDAVLTSDLGEKQLAAEYTRPLMGPKPTSFQLYLDSKSQSELKHWDEDAYIRGYKMYWHQDIGQYDWHKRKDDVGVTKGTSKIMPLDSGSEFLGRIRFSQLTDIELGALLSVFFLARDGKEIVYKLGQGKSIGMGSITINAKDEKPFVVVSDEENRYTTLLDDKGWNNPSLTIEPLQLIESFEKYRQAHVPSNIYKFFTESLEELYTLMDWKNVKKPKWAYKVKYMEVGSKRTNKYKNRVRLAKPVEFVKKDIR